MKLAYNRQIVSLIKTGGVGILPTDTIYGLVGSALIPKAVKRIYKIRARDLGKPMIILIASGKQVRLFGARPSVFARRVIKKVWPGPVSIILSCKSKKFLYLHRGKKSLAFRVPAHNGLRNFLKKTGPLVAPSANMAGKPPAQTIMQARAYFGNAIDFYISGKKRKSAPSTVISLTKGKLIMKRKGLISVFNSLGDK